jgi:hypothetical protein
VNLFSGVGIATAVWELLDGALRDEPYRVG